jgi:hypothetical protein
MNGNAPISESENGPISCLKVGGNAPFYATPSLEMSDEPYFFQ